MASGWFPYTSPAEGAARLFSSVAARKEGTSAGLKITLPQLGDKSVELSGNSIENGNSEDLVPALPLISCLTLSNSFAFS